MQSYELFLFERNLHCHGKVHLFVLFCFVSFGGSTSSILSSAGQVSFPKQLPGSAKVF